MNPENVELVATPIEEVPPGSSLLIKHEGRPVLFQVENKKFSYTPESGTVWTLESEPVDGGEPWRIQGAPGMVTQRIVKKR